VYVSITKHHQEINAHIFQPHSCCYSSINCFVVADSLRSQRSMADFYVHSQVYIK